MTFPVGIVWVCFFQVCTRRLYILHSPWTIDSPWTIILQVRQGRIATLNTRFFPIRFLRPRILKHVIPIRESLTTGHLNPRLLQNFTDSNASPTFAPPVVFISRKLSSLIDHMKTSKYIFSRLSCEHHFHFDFDVDRPSSIGRIYSETDCRMEEVEKVCIADRMSVPELIAQVL